MYVYYTLHIIICIIMAARNLLFTKYLAKVVMKIYKEAEIIYLLYSTEFKTQKSIHGAGHCEVNRVFVFI